MDVVRLSFHVSEVCLCSYVLRKMNYFIGFGIHINWNVCLTLFHDCCEFVNCGGLIKNSFYLCVCLYWDGTIAFLLNGYSSFPHPWKCFIHIENVCFTKLTYSLISKFMCMFSYVDWFMPWKILNIIVMAVGLISCTGLLSQTMQGLIGTSYQQDTLVLVEL